MMFGLVLLVVANGARAETVTNPDWLVRPSAEDMSAAFPDLAAGLHITGRATVSCHVDTIGRARNCEVISSSPEGLGFEQAALKLTEVFRFSPKKIDGRPVPGGTVRVPIRFTIPNDNNPPTAPALPAASRHAVDLALQMAPVLEQKLREDYGAQATKITEDIQRYDPLAAAAARSAYKAAVESMSLEWAKQIAKVHAQLMTEEELSGRVAFAISPVGRAALFRSADQSDDEVNPYDRWQQEVAALARPVFCAKQQCEEVAWTPSTAVGFSDPPLANFPHPETIREYMPPIPRLLGLAGWAQLNCIIGDDGAVDPCIAARESPEKLGFGKAAEALADQYVVNMNAAAGRGPIVAIPVSFSPPPILKALAETGTPPSPEAVALSERVLMASGMMENLAEARLQFEAAISQWTIASPDVRDDAIAALRGAVGEADRATIMYFAKRQASNFSIEELQALLAHQASPSGKAYRRNGQQFLEQLTALSYSYNAKINAEARRLFCKDRVCEESPAPTPVKAP